MLGTKRLIGITEHRFRAALMPFAFDPKLDLVLCMSRDHIMTPVQKLNPLSIEQNPSYGSHWENQARLTTGGSFQRRLCRSLDEIATIDVNGWKKC